MTKLINLLLKWRGVPTTHQLLERVPKELKEVFTSEAKYILSTKYHKWLVEDLELMAERWMFRGNKEDLLVGKGILYCLHMLDGNLKTMSGGVKRLDSPEKKKMRRFK